MAYVCGVRVYVCEVCVVCVCVWLCVCVCVVCVCVCVCVYVCELNPLVYIYVES